MFALRTLYLLELNGSFFLYSVSLLWVYLGCTSFGTINEGLLWRNSLKGTKIKYVAMELNTSVNFKEKVWTWCAMTKGLKVLSWVHPRNKWIEFNLQKRRHQWLYLQSLMESFSMFSNEEKIEAGSTKYANLYRTTA